jgi:hypothetical protein
MHLSKGQSDRFLRLLNLLTLFANQHCGLFDPALTSLTGETATAIGYALWPDPDETIDAFVAENPYGLSTPDLAAVSLWKKGVYSRFYAMEHREGKTLLLGPDGFVYAVQGIDQDISELLVDLPAAVEMSILPFDGELVHGGVFEEWPSLLVADLREGAYNAFEDALNSGLVVETPFDLMERAPIVRQINQRMEQVLDGWSGCSPAAEGWHRGALAGLPEDERSRARQEVCQSRKDSNPGLVARVLREGSLHRRPVRTLHDVLDQHPKHDLVDHLAAHPRTTPKISAARAKPYDELGKNELVEALVDAVSTDAELARDSAVFATPSQYRALRELSARGGTVEFTAEQAPLYLSWEPMPVFTELYYWDRTFTYIIPEELRASYLRLDWDEVERRRELVGKVQRCADALVSACGAVPFTEAYEQFCEWYGALMGEDDFLHCLLESRDGSNVIYELWITPEDDPEAEPYLVNIELMAPPDDDMTDIGELDDEFDAAVLELIDAHSLRPRRRLPREMAQTDYIAWVSSLEPLRDLRNYLDEHVPNGSDDYFYADFLTNQTVMLRQGAADLPAILELFGSYGAIPSGGDVKQLADVLVKAVDACPTWLDNGWAPRELRGATPTCGPC